MNAKVMKKKIENAVKTHNEWLAKHSSSSKQVTARNAFDVPFKVTRNTFEGSNFFFDPFSLYATSYRWWEMLKVTKGELIFNDYSYSISTSKHQWKLRSILSDLKIKYKTLEAPQGLQDLDSALRHHEYQLAKEIVRRKYSRDGKPSAWKGEKYHTTKLELLKTLGHKTNSKRQKAALISAEEERSNRLKRSREAAALKRALAKVEVTLVQGGAQ